jgi:hypothetical protein
MKPSNLLPIDSLHDDWCDKDEIMLHACFQLLVDCIEKENLFEGATDFTQDDEHEAAKLELQTLYEWWGMRKHKDQSIHSLSTRQYDLDNEMLIRLIAHRRWLWT